MFVYTYWQKCTQTEPLLQGVRIHDLRHTFATERVGLMGIEELRALMGHENIQTTLRVASSIVLTVKYRQLNLCFG